ncbi:MAG: HAD-IC family P-type ATPase [Clostridia bacterium]|nr:HAD-IC family P-type ATPase [Clostridia bacterium]
MSKNKEKLKSKNTTKKQKTKTEKVNIQRYNPNPEVGLTAEQVAKRTESNLVNVSTVKTGKSVGKIFLTNICTFFNLTCLLVAAALISVGAYSDLLFMIIVTLNTTIGIVQEIRAKKTMDKLSLTNSNFSKVIRDGEEEEIYKTEIVLDDVLCLNPGMQIACDSIVLEGHVEVNESLLTGESVPVKKYKGDGLLGGSFISSGTCKAKVNKIGNDNYISQLSEKAKQFKKSKSELLTSLRSLIKIITVFMVPIAIIMLYNNYTYYTENPALEYSLHYMVITKTSGCIIAMIPAGMFLLTSVALAVSVMRLAKKHTLVQELYCIEMLARTNVLCLDKTGTLTNGSMSVKDVVLLSKSTDKDVEKIVASMVGAFHDANHTALALKAYFGKPSMHAEKSLPFSSERKFMGCKFKGSSAYKLGAYEYVMDNPSKELAKLVEEYAQHGYRVLLLAESDNNFSNKNCKPIALILLEDNIRKDAPKTIAWFKQNEVDIKIISGDNPVTVSEVARRVGVENYDKYISLQGLSSAEVVEAANKYSIFGRVSPEQKAILVKTLKSQGKTVAMTGDGVNDILALKEADCSIAIAAGSDAARSVSQLVLLDSNFSSMPSVVAEGRRVVNNIQKSSSLFLMKTIFAICISIFVLCMNKTYPFSPIQFVLLEMFVIGLPSFFLALQPNTNRIKGKFLSNVARNTLPAGLCLVGSTIAMYVYQIITGISTEVLVTMASLAIIVVGFMSLFKMCKPFNWFKSFMYVACLAICVAFILLVPTLFKYVAISYTDKLFLIIVCQFAYPVYLLVNKIFDWSSRLTNTDE